MTAQHDLFDVFHFDTKNTDDTRFEEEAEKKLDFPEKRTLKSVYYRDWARTHGVTVPALTRDETQMMVNVREALQQESSVVRRMLNWLGSFDKSLKTDENAFKRATLPSLLADDIAWRGHTMF